jgi:hypothetical protein
LEAKWLSWVENESFKRFGASIHSLGYKTL